jgi:hypothetical protein
MKVGFWMLFVCVLHAQTLSEWAFEGPDHRLHYRPDVRLNVIMDFSSAGYRAGGVKLPSAAVAQRLTPAAGDNTARIQAALDSANGAVVLAPGEYEIAGTLTIARGGVVLRGEKGAVIRLTGKPHRFLDIRGTGSWREEGSPAPVLESYVPAGANRFRVGGAQSFHGGDRVLVLRPVTAEWIRFMGMEPLVRGGQPETWIRAGAVVRTDRTIDWVLGDSITLDAPLSDALDARFGAASVVRYSFPGRIAEAGVESLRIVAPFQDTAAEPPYTAVLMDAVEDGWARDLDIQDATGIIIGPGARRLTVANVRVTHSPAHVSSDPADFVLRGTQILLDRCSVTGAGAGPVATDSEAVGPLVVLNFTADHGGIAAAQPWATGLLVDGGKFPGGTRREPALAFSTRGTAAPDRAWDIGWSVAWNVASPFFLVPQPHDALNWCVGCIGAPVTITGAPNGIFDSLGKTVEPSSLYLHQLRDRIGPDALRNIGY